MSPAKRQTGVPPPETSEMQKLRLELLNAEDQQRQLEEGLAALQGKLKMKDVDDLRQKLAEAQAALDAAANDLEKSKKKLTDAEQFAAEETARADRSAMKASALNDLNLNLTGVVQVLKSQTVVSTAPAPASALPTRTDVQKFTPWYKKRCVLAIAGVALVLLIVVAGIKVLSHQSDGVGATTGAVFGAVSEPKPETKSAPVVPSIQSPTPSRSRSCPYASLIACVDDMAKRVGGVPSEFIQSRGAYWCQRVGCQ